MQTVAGTWGSGLSRGRNCLSQVSSRGRINAVMVAGIASCSLPLSPCPSLRSASADSVANVRLLSSRPNTAAGSCSCFSGLGAGGLKTNELLALTAESGWLKDGEWRGCCVAAGRGGMKGIFGNLDTALIPGGNKAACITRLFSRSSLTVSLFSSLTDCARSSQAIKPCTLYDRVQLKMHSTLCLKY